MAKILEADNALKEHTKNDLGVEIESFEVGDEKVNGIINKMTTSPNHCSYFIRILL